MTTFFMGQKDRIKAVATLEIDGEEKDFILYFKEIKTSAQAEMQQMASKPDETIARALDLLVEHIVDWEGVLDSEGEEVEFNEENLHALLDVPMYFSASLDALTSQETPEKN